MDEIMCMYHNLRGTGQRQAPRGGFTRNGALDRGARSCPSFIHPGCRYFGHLHGVAMYKWLPVKIPDHEPSGGHSIAIVSK